jgi:hypothetical protein
MFSQAACPLSEDFPGPDEMLGIPGTRKRNNGKITEFLLAVRFEITLRTGIIAIHKPTQISFQVGTTEDHEFKWGLGVPSGGSPDPLRWKQINRTPAIKPAPFEPQVTDGPLTNNVVQAKYYEMLAIYDNNARLAEWANVFWDW